MAIELKGVWKSFNGTHVLKDVNLKIREGEFVVIAGENGSGKSTLLKIISGLLVPDKGEVRVFGYDMMREWKKASKILGVVLANERSLYWKLTGMENLEVFAGLYGVKNWREKAEYLLKRLGLENAKDKLVEEYSTGMRKKLLLAKALIHDPKVLLLDEVLNGLDPRAVTEVISFLQELNSQGVTIVLVSHILHGLPENGRLIVMREGRIIADDRLSRFSFDTLRITATINGEEVEVIAREEELDEKLRELIRRNAQDIRVERDDLYSVLRRLLNEP
ncbi:ABC transporter ATP-binding protein [Thermococcus chitonophagus]|uniref:ABC transporter, ATP-binding protein n=1 Tax=Thermococcus chitonophagus TaxID=54262 RepID=A0A160VR94_9EURY|nr:ABC transporter ATP-binding protein [Thermococcus chitonophagus]CUX77483.1 ABC transporter, ATP-binding protein [Thermococcus chitonophagus]